VVIHAKAPFADRQSTFGDSEEARPFGISLTLSANSTMAESSFIQLNLLASCAFSFLIRLCRLSLLVQYILIHDTPIYVHPHDIARYAFGKRLAACLTARELWYCAWFLPLATHSFGYRVLPAKLYGVFLSFNGDSENSK